MRRLAQSTAALFLATLLLTAFAACFPWKTSEQAASRPAANAGSRAAARPLPTVPPGILGNGDATVGRELFASKGCTACHKVGGEGGSAGPEIDGIGDRTKRPTLIGELENTPENLWRWITNPQLVKPGTLMASQPLTPQEAADLVAYLETLK
ncbi:MAG: cytochrome c [Chloroflexota bacterium]|nr:cytochrome c [Chloroflexota bacterium]MDE2841145.1 cytochrome c [Chloroflexota bacterium]MDE2930169.1 cytochrome c [Chloroflexota bacterium]